MRDRRPNGYWGDSILPLAAEIVDSSDTPVTLRQVFYGLVAYGTPAGLFPRRGVPDVAT